MTESLVPWMISTGAVTLAIFRRELKSWVTRIGRPGIQPYLVVCTISPMLVKLDSTIRPANGAAGTACDASSTATAPPRLCPYTKRLEGSG
ncbi:Uncharacterised protein [Mycobacteroides abscessus subsp. abscessus]|nr:Uncharacterised protein [Mycobacteroides abscessus subsp. abscessus]